MKVKEVMETPEGTVTFQGVIEGPELEFAISYFLNQMLVKGALPFINRDPVNVDVSGIQTQA